MNQLRKYDRKHMRLKGYDYSQTGMYFITICTKNRKHLFGHIKNGKMILNEYGNIIHDYWINIPTQYNNVELDEYIVMPDHFHGIIRLNFPKFHVGALFIASNNKQNISFNIKPNIASNVTSNHKIIYDNRATINNNHNPANKINLENQTIIKQKQDVANQLDAINRTPTKIVAIGAVMRSFKAGCTHAINKMANNIGVTIWQRNYYEHIIRDKNEYDRITKYIKNNPLNW